MDSLFEIFSLLEVQDLISICSVCKQWREIAMSNRLWKVKLEQDFSEERQEEVKDADDLHNWKRYQSLYATQNEYFKEMRKLEPPTDEQLITFTQYVSGAHSWYKHLPAVGGFHFTFFISPTAGMRYHDKQWMDYVEGDGTRFHYTWAPTETYRRNHGYLDYTETGAHLSSSLRVSTVEGKQLKVPKKVMDCTIKLTALVHSYALQYRLLSTIYTKFERSMNVGECVDWSTTPFPPRSEAWHMEEVPLHPDTLHYLQEFYVYEQACKNLDNEEILEKNKQLLEKLHPGVSTSITFRDHLDRLKSGPRYTLRIVELSENQRLQAQMRKNIFRMRYLIWKVEHIPEKSAEKTKSLATQ